MTQNTRTKSFISAVLLALFLSMPAFALAEEFFHRVPFTELSIKKGTIPTPKAIRRRALPDSSRISSFVPYVLLGNGDEAYIDCPSTGTSRRSSSFCTQSRFLIVKTSSKGPISGKLFVPNRESSQLVSLGFSHTPKKFDVSEKESFKKAKNRYYGEILASGASGAAWFRHKLGKDGIPSVNRSSRSRSRMLLGSPEATYGMMVGARAIAENLQLDRVLPFNDPTKETVELSSLTGITIQEYDWTALLEGKTSKLDPLAHYVAEDQYGLFFPSYEAFSNLIDEARDGLVPIFDLFESRSEDHKSLERYEAQLGLSLEHLPSSLGAALIEQVVLTSSDPYVRSGTDIALIFKSSSPDLLFQLIKAKAKTPHIKKAKGLVIVSNSAVQIAKFENIVAGKLPSMASLKEYKYFRSRYKRGVKETAFLMVPDAAIRKWSGPKWRIAASRRLRAAAVMNKLNAEHFSAYQKSPTAPLKKLSELGLNDISIDASGIRSEEYGKLAHLTPISEIDFSKVTSQEASMYKRFRDSYQRRWANFFDPIAIQFSFSETKLEMDLTVMPLIGQSDYRSMMELIGGDGLDAMTLGQNDILNLSFGLNKESDLFRIGNSMFSNYGLPLVDPLAWLGDSITLRMSDTKFWSELSESKNPRDFFEDNYTEIPVGIELEVVNRLQLAGFLTALRSMANQSAPGVLKWENLSHKEQQYVKVTTIDSTNLSGSEKERTVYYAILPNSLVLTMDEGTLFSAIGFSGQNSKEKDVYGKHINMIAKSRFVKATEGIFGNTYQSKVRDNCLQHLAILNEWRKEFPKSNPLEVHEKHWGAKLRCEGGFQWNEEAHTMESIKYGHPAALRELDSSIGPVEEFETGHFGLTFEDDGLRARVLLEKKGQPIGTK